MLKTGWVTKVLSDLVSLFTVLMLGACVMQTLSIAPSWRDTAMLVVVSLILRAICLTEKWGEDETRSSVIVYTLPRE